MFAHQSNSFSLLNSRWSRILATSYADIAFHGYDNWIMRSIIPIIDALLPSPMNPNTDKELLKMYIAAVDWYMRVHAVPQPCGYSPIVLPTCIEFAALCCNIHLDLMQGKPLNGDHLNSLARHISQLQITPEQTHHPIGTPLLNEVENIAVSAVDSLLTENDESNPSLPAMRS